MAQRRIVAFHGDKGGVGKSTMARATLDYHLRNDHVVTAVDADTQNPQLHRYYKNATDVHRIDVFSRDGYDQILDLFAESEGDLLVDLPAGSGRTLKSLMQDFGLGDALNDLNARMTLAFGINRVKDSVIALKDTLLLTEGLPVDYVVIKNLYFGGADRFERYDNSKTRQAIYDNGGVELHMPELFDSVYDFLDDHSLPFKDAAQHKDLSFAQKQRVRKFMREWDAEIERAGDFM
jgi:hypothetical protein